MITRGVMDIKGFEQIFQEVLTATQPLRDCKLWSICKMLCVVLGDADIQAFVDGVQLDQWPLLTDCHRSTTGNRPVRPAVCTNQRFSEAWS